MLLECINTSVWNLFIIPEEDWSQSKSIEEYEVNKLKNEDGYSCFYAFVQDQCNMLHFSPQIPEKRNVTNPGIPVLCACAQFVSLSS